MCAKWKDVGFDFDFIFREIEASKVKGGKKPSFDAFRIHDLESILVSAVQFSSGVPRCEKVGLVRGGVFEAAKKGIISSETVIREVANKERNFLRKNNKNYFLKTSFNISKGIPFKSLIVGDCKIFFDFSASKLRAYELGNQTKYSLKSKKSMGFKEVLITTSGRSKGEAGEKGLDAFNLLRAIWNLYLNLHQSRRFTFNQMKPVNKVLTGPLHLLFDDRGKYLPELWWYEPFFEEVKLENLSKYQEKLRHVTMVWLRRLKKSSLREDIQKALHQYCEALDNRDFGKAFLELWSVLEFLTFTEKERYTTTIRRAAYMYHQNDEKFQKQVLQHLRLRRNLRVHSVDDIEDTETLLFQLKDPVERLIRFYLNNPFNFSSRAEIGQFLSQPRGGAELEKRIKFARSAMRWGS